MPVSSVPAPCTGRRPAPPSPAGAAAPPSQGLGREELLRLLLHGDRASSSPVSGCPWPERSLARGSSQRWPRPMEAIPAEAPHPWRPHLGQRRRSIRQWGSSNWRRGSSNRWWSSTIRWRRKSIRRHRRSNHWRRSSNRGGGNSSSFPARDCGRSMEKPLRVWASLGPSWAPSESTAFRLYSAAMGEQAEDEHGRRLDDDEIIDILIMYLNAGHESSGHITMWATVFLRENLDIFAKAKAEQEAIMRSIPPTQQGLTLRDFRKMEYLSQVIDETLRFVNISFVSFRQATKDVSVNGYLIPKGWKVQLWYRSMHMDPQVSHIRKPDDQNWRLQK